MGGHRLLTAVAAGLVAGAAQLANAADLPVPAAAADLPVPASVAPVYSWTGCYVGAQVGLGALQDSYTQAFPTQFNPVTGFPATTSNQWGFGGLAGAQLGCNYQIGHFVFGAEADVWASSLSTNSNFSSFGFAAKASATNPFDFDVAGRAGFAYDRVLFYGKAGFAAGSFDYNFTSNFGPAQAAHSTSPGIVVGAGIEYAIFPEWTLKGEADLLVFSSDVDLACNVFCAGPPAYTSTINASELLFKIGANYKFY